MKKIFCLITVFALALSLFGCQKADAEIDSEYKTKTNTELTVNQNSEETQFELEDSSSTEEKSSSSNQTSVEESLTPTQCQTTKRNQGTQKPNSTSSNSTNPNSSKPSAAKPSSTKPTSGSYPVKDPINSTGVVTNTDLNRIKAEFLKLINNERKSKGLSPLTLNKELDRVAVIRSREIISTWSHTRPNGTDYFTAINENAYFYSSIGENIGKTSFVGVDTVSDTVKYTGSDEQISKICTTMFNMFKNSPTHYANIMSSSFTNTGIGISCKLDSNGLPMFYISQIFGSL